MQRYVVQCNQSEGHDKDRSGGPGMNNEYDNEVFFSEYAKMSRSREGLSAAGEWSRLKLCFPPLQGKTVLDLGCGYGWHCMYAAEQGAARVLGLDLSRKMIEFSHRSSMGEPRSSP